KQTVCVKVESDGRSLIFDDVVVRVNPNFALAMHIDTDESNAAGAKPGMMGEIL
ncbi:MAG: propanediol utilization protein, partial [Clostridia bacterium]|nr:propanediol utilization protein [Clostridia bacterium]